MSWCFQHYIHLYVERTSTIVFATDKKHTKMIPCRMPIAAEFSQTFISIINFGNF